MTIDCKHCFKLVKTGCEDEHPHLKTVNNSQQSKLCKCSNCGSLLMNTLEDWDIVLKGSVTRQSRRKTNAA